MISLLKMKISGVPDLLYMFPIFSDFLQKHTYMGGAGGGVPKILFWNFTIRHDQYWNLNRAHPKISSE